MKAFEKRQDDYLNNELSPAEQSVLRAYLNEHPQAANSFFQLAQDYLRGYLDDLDERLRFYRDKDVSIKNITDLKKAVRIFDGIFEKAPPLTRDVTVYRSKDYFHFLREGYFRLKPGDIIQEKGYLSTAFKLDPRVLEAYGLRDTALVAGREARQKLKEEGMYVKSIREIPKRHATGPDLYVADLQNPCCVMKIRVPKGTPVLLVYLFEGNENQHENEYLFPRGTELRFIRHSIKDGIGMFEFDMLPLVPSKTDTPSSVAEIKRKRGSSPSSGRKRIKTDTSDPERTGKRTGGRLESKRTGSGKRWNDYTLKELREFAKKMGIRGYSVKKNELVKKLAESRVRLSDIEREMRNIKVTMP